MFVFRYLQMAQRLVLIKLCVSTVAILLLNPQAVSAEGLGGRDNNPAGGQSGQADAQGAVSAVQTSNDSALKADLQGRVEKLKNHKEKLAAATKLAASAASAETATTTCETAAVAAGHACIESLSPIIQEVIPKLSMIGSALSIVTGMSEKCEQANKGYELLQGALVAYQAACTGAQMYCKSKCTSAQKASEQVLAELDACSKNTASSQQSVECGNQASIINSTQNAYSAVQAGCNQFQQQIAGAVIGAAAMIKSISDSKDCADKTAASENVCISNPNAPGCVDCTKEEYFSHSTCICAQNPRAPGCSQASNDLGTTPQSAALNRDTSGVDANNPYFNLSSPNSDLGAIEGSDPTLAGAGANAAGGVLGGGGGGAPNKGVDGGAGGPASKINPNVIGGETSGGGGGGRQAGAFGSGGSNPYARFLPGAGNPNLAANKARDPASDPAQITGKNGLSNFEKIKRRYIENRSTLLSR